MTNKQMYWFWIKREQNKGLEKFAVYALSSFEAMKKLPKCVHWNFMVRR